MGICTQQLSNSTICLQPPAVVGGLGGTLRPPFPGCTVVWISAPLKKHRSFLQPTKAQSRSRSWPWHGTAGQFRDSIIPLERFSNPTQNPGAPSSQPTRAAAATLIPQLASSSCPPEHTPAQLVMFPGDPSLCSQLPREEQNTQWAGTQLVGSHPCDLRSSFSLLSCFFI